MFVLQLTSQLFLVLWNPHDRNLWCAYYRAFNRERKRANKFYSLYSLFILMCKNYSWVKKKCVTKWRKWVCWLLNLPVPHPKTKTMHGICSKLCPNCGNKVMSSKSSQQGNATIIQLWETQRTQKVCPLCQCLSSFGPRVGNEIRWQVVARHWQQAGKN